jgi:hypothetical protein
MHDNTIYLSVGLIAELFTASVTYDANRNAAIDTSEIKIEISIGQRNITVNGTTEILEADIIILNDRVMVPIGVMNFFGFDEPIWDDETQEIVLVKTYQTFRLIVMTNGKELVETHGAIEVIKGANNLYVLQYTSERATREANRLFNEDADIIFSEPDAIVHVNSSVNQSSTENISWGTPRIGADYFSEQLQGMRNTNTVIVAVLDDRF